MTDKEKLIERVMLLSESASFEDIIKDYLRTYKDDFSTIRLNQLILDINYSHLSPKLVRNERIIELANERAFYLSLYLSGQMYKDEETAKEHLNLQVDHANAILKACKER